MRNASCHPEKRHYAKGLCKSCYRTSKYPQSKRYVRDWQLRRDYGITLEEYEALLEKQEGKCALCRGKQGGRKTLSVDHDHETGRVRGLLCFVCNTYVERLVRDPSMLSRIQDYLR